MRRAAAGFLYVEKIAPADARNSAQATFNMAVMGIGPMCAGIYNQALDRFFTAGTSHPDFRVFWFTQAAIAAAALIALSLAFTSAATGPKGLINTA